MWRADQIRYDVAKSWGKFLRFCLHTFKLKKFTIDQNIECFFIIVFNVFVEYFRDQTILNLFMNKKKSIKTMFENWYYDVSPR